METGQGKRTATFWTAKHHLKSSDVEDTDTKAEGEPQRFSWEFSRGRGRGSFPYACSRGSCYRGAHAGTPRQSSPFFVRNQRAVPLGLKAQAHVLSFHIKGATLITASWFVAYAEDRGSSSVTSFSLPKVLIQKSPRFSVRSLRTTAFPPPECFQSFSQAAVVESVAVPSPLLVFHRPYSVGPVCLTVFWSPNSHPSVQCAHHWKIPTLFSLAPRRCQSKQRSHHKLLLMFQEKRPSSSCRLSGQWWWKHEDAKRISRMCMHHPPEGEELAEDAKRTTAWIHELKWAFTVTPTAYQKHCSNHVLFHLH